MKLLGTLATGLALALAAHPALGEERERPLTEVIELAVKHSPDLSASRFREQEAEHSVSIARSGFLPTLDFEVIDSTGFPGSSGLTGVGGLMGSPYRSGAAYGVVLRQVLWDFGRTLNAVEAAKGDVEARKAEAGISTYRIKLAAMNAYFECSRSRSLKDAWSALRGEAELVAKEISRFVTTGQRSIVERYLVEAQMEEAITAEASFSEKLKADMKRLSIITGLPEAVRCSALPAAETAVAIAAPSTGSNPFLARASQELRSAKARLDQAKAGHMPKIVAVASVGDVENARFVEKQAYSVAGALIFPLFDGLRTTSEVRRAEAQVSEREARLSAEQQHLDELNTRLDEIIDSAKARLEHLHHEQKLAEEGFHLAKKRYFSFQGNLVDIREALRNVVRTRTQLDDTTAEYLEAFEGKSLLNGM